MKTKSIRCGNWERVPLSQAQLKYAALDAYASLRCYEELCLHPLLQLPECNVTHSKTNGSASTSKECQENQAQLGLVPQLMQFKHLSPSKEAAYNLFMGNEGKNKCDLEKIARLQGIQLTTAESYIASAILSGRPYDWQRLGIEDNIVLKVGLCVSEVIENSQVSLAVNKAASQGQAQDILSMVSNLRSSLGDHLSPSGILVDLGSIMKQYKCGLKELKERINHQTGYSTIILVLAHLSRLLTATLRVGESYK